MPRSGIPVVPVCRAVCTMIWDLSLTRSIQPPTYDPSEITSHLDGHHRLSTLATPHTSFQFHRPRRASFRHPPAAYCPCYLHARAQSVRNSWRRWSCGPAAVVLRVGGSGGQTRLVEGASAAAAVATLLAIMTYGSGAGTLFWGPDGVVAPPGGGGAAPRQLPGRPLHFPPQPNAAAAALQRATVAGRWGRRLPSRGVHAGGCFVGAAVVRWPPPWEPGATTVAATAARGAAIAARGAATARPSSLPRRAPPTAEPPVGRLGRGRWPRLPLAGAHTRHCTPRSMTPARAPPPPSTGATSPPRRSARHSPRAPAGALAAAANMATALRLEQAFAGPQPVHSDRGAWASLWQCTPRTP